jgi:hypothetical protein
MKEQRKFRVHANKYHALARGYAALKSNLAEPAKGAAEAYQRLADETEQGARTDRENERARAG